MSQLPIEMRALLDKMNRTMLTESENQWDEVEFILPAHWASALINGDTTGMSDEEEQELNDFIAKNPDVNHVSSVEELGFMRGRASSLPNGLDGDYAKYTGIKKKKIVSEAPAKKAAPEDTRPRDKQGRIDSPHISFDSGKDKITAQVSSTLSAKYTKLGQNMQRIDELAKELKILQAETKDELKTEVAGLFSAADAARTRVVETKQFIFQISKDPKATETVKYKEVLTALEEHLTPELKNVMESLVKQFTGSTQRSPTIGVKKVNESVAESYLDKVEDWAEQYDLKLEKLKNYLS